MQPFAEGESGSMDSAVALEVTGPASHLPGEEHGPLVATHALEIGAFDGAFDEGSREPGEHRVA